MKHRLSGALTLFLAAAAAFALLLLPRLLHEQSVTGTLGRVTIARMDALPAEQTPAPVSKEELTEQALTWFTRADESAAFARRREDVSPADDELTQAQAWECVYAQVGALAAWGIPFPQDMPAAVYFRLTHGVTQEYQGYYTFTAGEGAQAVSYTVSATTGVLFECRYAAAPLPLPTLAEAFAALWGIDGGAVLEYSNYPSIGWERCIYGNGGPHYISIFATSNTSGYRVCLKQGTGKQV